MSPAALRRRCSRLAHEVSDRVARGHPDCIAEAHNVPAPTKRASVPANSEGDAYSLACTVNRSAAGARYPWGAGESEM